MAEKANGPDITSVAETGKLDSDEDTLKGEFEYAACFQSVC